MFQQAEDRGYFLSPFVREYVLQVYQTICLLTLIFSGGVYYGMYSTLTQSTLRFLPFFGSMILICLMNSRSIDLFYGSIGVSLFMGLGTSPLVSLAYNIDPTLPLIAALSTFCIFAAITLMVFIHPVPQIIYMGGFLVSCLNIAIMASLMNMFIQSEFLYWTELYFTLGVFIVLILYDTHLMIEKAKMRHRPDLKEQYVFDALNIFLDLVNVFVRLLIILIDSKRSNRKNKKRE